MNLERIVNVAMQALSETLGIPFEDVVMCRDISLKAPEGNRQLVMKHLLLSHKETPLDLAAMLEFTEVELLKFLLEDTLKNLSKENQNDS